MHRLGPIVLVAAGAAVLLVSSTLVWAVAAGSVAGAAVSLDGATCAPAVRAVGIVSLAGIGGLLAARGRGRVIVGAVLAAAAVLGGLSLVATLRDGLRAAAAAALPVSLDGSAAEVVESAWIGPLLAALGFAAVVVGAVGAMRSTRGALGERFDRTAPSRPAEADASPGADRIALWSALDRGEDPTREGTAVPTTSDDVAPSTEQDEPVRGFEQEGTHDGGAR